MVSFTLPTAGIGTSADGQSIVLRDDAAISRMAKALQRDSLADFVKSAKSGS